MMRVTGLHKAFGTHPVLTGVDLEVPDGSLTAILGPSGSGKTTLLRLLAGFERADQGEIVVGGTVVDNGRIHVPPERRRIGYVPQEGSLFPHLTVAANVAFGLPAKQRRGGKPDTLLAAVGLEGLGKRYPHQLSGGQQQRVALARALAIEPTVVLMDEPFASLDAHLRASVRADVQRIFHEAGTTAILVTHDQDEALSVADCVAVLRDGKIAQCAAPEDLYTAPADPALAAFVGEANLLPGVHVAGSVQTVLGLLPLHQNGGGFPPSGNVTVLVRPEQIELGPPDGSIRATVVAYGYHGHDAVLHVQPDETSPAAGSAAPDAPQEGAPLLVRVIGGDHIPVGSPVTLQARGPVIAWPAQPS
ncbi:MAG TPA: ATP-binding cassette domain-containing protein [Streptosporangiaceae bacterium]|nr:ATP-binding cassette domain-containing protein [Streptosporangiaceae bacterium]